MSRFTENPTRSGYRENPAHIDRGGDGGCFEMSVETGDRISSLLMTPESPGYHDAMIAGDFRRSSAPAYSEGGETMNFAGPERGDHDLQSEKAVMVHIEPRAFSTDKEMTRAINARLCTDLELDSSDITVNVCGSTVTLSGSVANGRDLRRAESHIRTFPHVYRIENHLRRRSTELLALEDPIVETLPSIAPLRFGSLT